MNKFSFTAKLEHIDKPGGWWLVKLPNETHEAIKPLMSHGSLKTEATIGKATWSTTIMPMGGGVWMLPIKADVRTAENLQLGDTINISFEPKLD
jgi:hypothetical protein